MSVVWLLNHYAADPTGSGGTRHYSLAKYAARFDMKIILIAASVEHLTGRQRMRSEENTRLEEIEGVTYLWVKTATYSGNGLSRIWNILQYTWRVLQSATVRGLPRPDVVVGSSVHPLAALAGKLLARRHGVPFVFEIRDLWPETLIQLGRIGRNSMTAVGLRWLERRLCSEATRIIVLLPKAGVYLERMGVVSEKVVWIPNGVDLEWIDYVEPTPRQHITVMYLGAHGVANGLSTILEAIAELQRQSPPADMLFRFIGDGPEKSRLQTMSRELGILDVVSFEPSVPKSRVPETLASADVFILNVLDLPLYEYGFSFNKLFDYLAAGRPIVFAGPAADNLVAEAQAGISVPSSDASAMAVALASLATMSPRDRADIGKRGRSYAEAHCSSAISARKFRDTIESVVG